MKLRVRVSMLAGLAIALGVAYCIFAAPRKDTRANVIRVEVPDAAVDDIVVDASRDVVYLVHNDGEESLDILGCQRL
jgi:hypothetical protein